MVTPQWCRVLGQTSLLLLLATASGTQELYNPRRVEPGPSGQLLVSDRSGAIVAVDADTLLPTWRYELPDEGAPFGLAVWNRLVYVGDTATRTVRVFRLHGALPRNATLRWLYDLGGTIPLEIAKPISIAVDRRERLVFVLDGAAKRVRIFDAKGVSVGGFGPADTGGQVLSPVSLAVDEARQELLISDFGDPSGSFRPRTPARVLIYGYDGSLLFQIDGNGATHPSTEFVRLQGLAVSGDGRIFATDPLRGRVLVIDRISGALLETLGERGPDPGELMLPLDVAVDGHSGDLFVTNNQGARPLEALRRAAR